MRIMCLCYGHLPQKESTQLICRQFNLKLGHFHQWPSRLYSGNYLQVNKACAFISNSGLTVGQKLVWVVLFYNF